MIETVIFDMDGVLVDSEPTHMQVNLEFFESIGTPVTDLAYKHEFVGVPPKDMMIRLKAEHQLSASVNELTEGNKALLLRTFAETELHPVGGVISLVRQLHRQGYTLAIGSSSCRELIEIITKRLGIADYFTHVVSGSDTERGKPAPDIFLEAARRCGSDPGACCVIEDSGNGVLAAKAARMHCAALADPEGHQDTSPADFQFESFSEDQIGRFTRFLQGL